MYPQQPTCPTAAGDGVFLQVRAGRAAQVAAMISPISSADHLIAEARAGDDGLDANGHVRDVGDGGAGWC